jgi:signal transduction histidine kinase
MYVPGQLSDVNNVLVDIGTGYYIDMVSHAHAHTNRHTYRRILPTHVHINYILVDIGTGYYIDMVSYDTHTPKHPPPHVHTDAHPHTHICIIYILVVIGTGYYIDMVSHGTCI